MSEELRANPDAILHRLEMDEQESKRTRGRLKVFLGAAAGVGKTYQMLEEARALKKEGLDIVASVVETHGRKETEDLLQDMEMVPKRTVEREGIVLEELDLDAVLARHPALALVDEMAHSNAPGSRHDKRYQDIEELLEAGISVYTTLNIQHVESLNDLVYQITGVKVRETVPDRLLEIADDLEVVDLPPEELLQRFQDGKVYIPRQAEQAMGRFFRKGNLLGLRELALRYTARQVDGELQSYMEMHDILGPWPAGSRLLVCISDSPLSEQLLRVGQRLAADLNAEWFAVHVESPQNAVMTESARARLGHNLQLAEELGAKVEVLTGHSLADELISFSKANNITLIVVGLPRKKRWSRIWKDSIVNQITQRSGPIHVLVIGSTDTDKPRQEAIASRHGLDWQPYLAGFLCTAVTAIICWPMKGWLEFVNIAMIMLLPVVFCGTVWGRKAGLTASVLAVAALDFFFVPPYFTFAVGDVRYLPSFFVFLAVGTVTSLLAELVHWQGESARQRERFVSSLYSFSRDMLAAKTLSEMLHLITQSVSKAFDCDVRIFLPNKFGQLQVIDPQGGFGRAEEREMGIATWVFQRGLKSGRGTDTLSSTPWSYYPLKANESTIGVLGVNLRQTDELLQPEQRQLLESFANVIALSLTRIISSKE
jgi:two-component system sensor histidine kinase KdpD